MRRGACQGLVLIVIVSGSKVGSGGKRFCRESDAGDNYVGDCGSDGGGGGQKKLTIFMTIVMATTSSDDYCCQGEFCEEQL